MARIPDRRPPPSPDSATLRKLYRVVHKIPITLIVANADGVVHFVNETFTELTGFRPEEALGKNLWELQCVNVNQEVCHQLKDTVLVQERWHGEMANWKKSGELYWEAVTVSGIRDEAGTLSEIVVTKEDITERKRTEEKLFESEERFKAFMDNSPALSWMKDKQGRYVYTCKTFGERLGLPERWEGKRDVELWPQETASAIWEKDSWVLQENRPYESVEEIPAPSGRRWWWSFRFPFTDAIGRIYVGGIGIDITDQKQVEEALKSNESLLRTVLENLPVGVWILDRDGTVIHANKAAHAIWGGVSLVRLDEFGDYKGWWIDTGKRIEAHEWGGARAITRGESSVDEVEIEGFDGSRKTIINSSVPLMNDEGDIVGAIVVNQDITKRKRAEEDRERLFAEVQRSNQELQQFAYVASHDLQEPLRMVASYISLLERRYGETLDAKAKGYINYAVDGARRMQKLIDGLLNYSRISRGADLLPTDTNEVFATAMANLEHAVRDTGGSVSRDELPVVQGDETQLIQLFQNLIANGLKYHKPGHAPAVHVSARPSGTEWIFSVRDNGIGIDPQYFDRVFQIFQRLHTKEEYPGTGIGLASCKKIVERHGGRIWVESTPGEGSDFLFTLPAER